MSTKKPTAASTAVKSRAASPVSQPIVRATLALAALTIAAAMILSYSAQAALAERCGLNHAAAWLFPVVVDVPLIASTLAATAMHNYRLRARLYPMATLLGYVAISVWLNAEHAATMTIEIATWLRVTILSIPALTLAVVVELALVVSRRAEPRALKPARTTIDVAPITVDVTPVVPAPVPVLARAAPRHALTAATTPRTATPSTTVRNGAAAKRTYTDADRAEWERLASRGISGRQIALQTGASPSAVQTYLASKGAVGAVA